MTAYEGQLEDDDERDFDDFDDDDDDYCDRCNEVGMYVICVDDLCHSGTGCIHGDGEIVCPYCKGYGKI